MSNIHNICISLFGRIYGTYDKFNFHKIIKKLYPNANIDIYVHCWEYDEYGIKYKNDINKITEFLNPKNIIIENLENIKYSGKFTCVYMLYSIQKSMLLVANSGIEYDLCFCVRPDIVVNVNPDINKIVIDENTINLYSCPNFATAGCSGICDWFYAGKLNTFKIIANMKIEFNFNVSNETNVYNNFTSKLKINKIGTIGNRELELIDKNILFD